MASAATIHVTAGQWSFLTPRMHLKPRPTTVPLGSCRHHHHNNNENGRAQQGLETYRVSSPRYALSYIFIHLLTFTVMYDYFYHHNDDENGGAHPVSTSSTPFSASGTLFPPNMHAYPLTSMRFQPLAPFSMLLLVTTTPYLASKGFIYVI